ncbi:hypothetical protein [Oryzibacter oryziterrae]|uniref:hypothetical protein n=1 Tax=Oryzibacter oryziterrae TaxID=2766474 RepID=UPI001F3B6E9C|nr:hypothetical protein [Oryzibacter oryziterrae]
MNIQHKRGRLLTQSLNRFLACSFLDKELLAARLNMTAALGQIVQGLPQSHPHLFASAPVFISREDVKAIQGLVRTVESVVSRPAYRDAVLANAPPIAGFEPGAKGVFFGYDFHMSDSGPRLIEINTNAGGAYLNWVLLEAQKACCEAVEMLMDEPLPHRPLPQLWTRMFQAEAGRAPNHIAIVDVAPREQYLYPEFLLAQAMFEAEGTQVSIVDPAKLKWTGEQLLADGKAVDVVYNRLTDFYFDEPASQALRAAYLSGTVAVTPHPRAHALLADKANLALLSDPMAIAALGASPEEVAILSEIIPPTRLVKAETAESLWAARKGLFFKPRAGFGSRAAYRGDKITTRVWAEILAHDYVAQEIVRPPERRVKAGADGKPLKFDLRAYAYDGEVQLLAARLYDGQTTNFRSAGGGFAPVFISPEPAG